MQTAPRDRLVFLVNHDQKIVVVRPIGFLSGQDFIERLFDHYSKLEAPWSFNRLSDFRRFEGFLSEDELQTIADRWRELARGVDYHAYVAVLSRDALDNIRIPRVSPMFPNETICMFSDFYEAMGWLGSHAKEGYLESLPPAKATASSKHDGIVVE